ncbi:MAG: recombinase family protein [Ruminococcus sp.]
MFDMYLAGYGIQTIANTLTAEGYPTVFGGDWHPYKVGAILDNEKYCGDLILQKTYRNNHIEKKKLRNTGQLQQVPESVKLKSHGKKKVQSLCGKKRL